MKVGRSGPYIAGKGESMPPAGIIVVCALGAISYLYVGKPIVHAAKKTGHAIVHVVTFGKK